MPRVVQLKVLLSTFMFVFNLKDQIPELYELLRQPCATILRSSPASCHITPALCLIITLITDNMTNTAFYEIIVANNNLHLFISRQYKNSYFSF